MYSDENEDYLPTGGYAKYPDHYVTDKSRHFNLQNFRSNLATLFGLDRSYKADGSSSKTAMTYTPLKQPKKQTTTAKGTPRTCMPISPRHVLFVAGGDAPALLVAATVESQKQ